LGRRHFSFKTRGQAVSACLPIQAGKSGKFQTARLEQLSFNCHKEKLMPLIAWLLGVPLSLVLILMLLGVF
jgi:hypothetical protein